MKKISFNKNLALAFMLFSMFLFSGCMSLDITQNLKSDGNSDVEIKYDFSAITGQMKALSENFGENSSTKDSNFSYCAEFDNMTKDTGFTCNEPEEDIVILRGSWESQEPYFSVEKTFTKTTYEYDVIEVFDIMNSLVEDESQEIDQNSISELEMMNADISYTLTMPAKVKSSEVGTIKEDTVEIDLFDLEGLDSAKVLAVKNNNTIYYIFLLNI